MGAKDGKIVAIDLEGNKIKEFTGAHSSPISSLRQSVEHEVVSGSFDGTAVVWDSETAEAKYQLQSGSKAVSVLTLPNGIVLTGG